MNRLEAVLINKVIHLFFLFPFHVQMKILKQVSRVGPESLTHAHIASVSTREGGRK